MLELVQTLYQASPRGYILSVPGYAFDLEDRMSPETAELVNQAIAFLKDKLAHPATLPVDI